MVFLANTNTEKERAETQLAQEQHKLERLENRKKFLEQVIQATISSEMKKIITKLQTDHAAQRGRDAFGTATRISASLFRRLSVFFESTPDQGPKAAKFAVLPPGHAGFPKRVERSEGSDTTPTSHVQKVLRTE